MLIVTAGMGGVLVARRLCQQGRAPLEPLGDSSPFSDLRHQPESSAQAPSSPLTARQEHLQPLPSHSFSDSYRDQSDCLGSPG